MGLSARDPMEETAAALQEGNVEKAKILFEEARKTHKLEKQKLVHDEKTSKLPL